jgi:hypothetical protein
MHHNVECQPPINSPSTDASNTPTELVHQNYIRFKWNAAFALQHCVAEAVAVYSVWCIRRIYRTYASNCMRWWLDRNSSRRWIFVKLHIQNTLHTIYGELLVCSKRDCPIFPRATNWFPVPFQRGFVKHTFLYSSCFVWDWTYLNIMSYPTDETEEVRS